MRESQRDDDKLARLFKYKKKKDLNRAVDDASVSFRKWLLNV